MSSMYIETYTKTICFLWIDLSSAGRLLDRSATRVNVCNINLFYVDVIVLKAEV